MTLVQARKRTFNSSPAESSRPHDQRGGIRATCAPRCDLDFLFYKEIVGASREVKTRYCAVAHIRHKHLGPVASVENGQVPRTVKQDRVADGGYLLTLTVDNRKRTRLYRIEHAVSRRQVANQHEPTR